MISVEGLSVEFNATPLFSDVNYVVNTKDRIALVGKNGAGKTTMLRLLAGLQAPTSGSVSWSKGLTIGYLPQIMHLEVTRTVIQETEQAFQTLFALQEDLRALNTELSMRSDYQSPQYQRLLERLSAGNERFVLLGGMNYKSEIEKTLLGLGFERTDFDRPTSQLSGGWRMRIELAKILLQKPDVLLLDEPTNHLDIESIQWLEDFLASSRGAVILVSHDRAFLNNVTTRTIEISCGRIYDYNVKYDQFVSLRQERRAQQLRAYRNQRKRIEETEAFIERFRYKATKAVQVQSRVKQLEKVERIEVDEEDHTVMRLKFPPSVPSGSYPLVCEHVSKAFGERLVLKDVTLTVKRGEKVAFVGKNGTGKTTLVKCVMGELVCQGKLTLGHNVKIGYFAQNQASLLDGEITVFDTIDRVATGDIRLKINDILGAFMFGGENSEKRVKVLSGGEKTRLAMIKLLLEPVNFLILDEPTNHLDMSSKDVLKEAVREFQGTVIVVSHDRDFLDGLVSKVYEFGALTVKEHIGSIREFLEKKKLEDLASLNTSSTVPSEMNSAAMPFPSEGRQTYQALKERNKTRKRLEKRIADCETEITRTEAAIAVLENLLSSSQAQTDATLYTKHHNLKTQLERTMTLWEELSTQMDILSNETLKQYP